MIDEFDRMSNLVASGQTLKAYPGEISSVGYQVNRSLNADEVDRQEGDIVHIGPLDPGGAESLNAEGFRRWSGSARSQTTKQAAARLSAAVTGWSG